MPLEEPWNNWTGESAAASGHRGSEISGQVRANIVQHELCKGIPHDDSGKGEWGFEKMAPKENGTLRRCCFVGVGLTL